MQCPRDGTTLTSEPYEGDVVVERCASCAGLWLDSGELKAVQETIEHDYAGELQQINAVARAYEIARQQARPEIDCPVCHSHLEPREYAYCSQILIDRCVTCGGVWLDAGELQALEKFFETARAESQEEQAQEEARSEMRRGFFASLWQRLV